jgi:hypothetical protein
MGLHIACTLFLEDNKLVIGEDPVQIRVFDVRDVETPLFSLKTSRNPCKVRSLQNLLVCGYRSWGVSFWEF